jgi:hypothetical protein
MLILIVTIKSAIDSGGYYPRIFKPNYGQECATDSNQIYIVTFTNTQLTKFLEKNQTLQNVFF